MKTSLSMAPGVILSGTNDPDPKDTLKLESSSKVSISLLIYIVDWIRKLLYN